MIRFLFLLGLLTLVFSIARPEMLLAAEPVGIIFDTDVGNDIDDALALSVIHALEARGECRLLAVTVTKDNPFAPRFIDAVNTFYGRPDIPIGIVKGGKTPEDGSFLKPIVEAAENGMALYPHDLKEAPDAMDVLRDTLAKQPDGSVVIVQVGFSTNLAQLLDAPAQNGSPLSGRNLVAKKCRLLSIMAGNFAAKDHVPEYNVHIDADSVRKLLKDWPTPIVASGFEIGRVIHYPAASILSVFAYVPHHPVAEAYKLYQKMPYDRETWDLTSVLYAVRPDAGYFGVSDPGRIEVDAIANTQFVFEKDGMHRYLTVTPEQIIRVKEALVQLASQPPSATPKP